MSGLTEKYNWENIRKKAVVPLLGLTLTAGGMAKVGVNGAEDAIAIKAEAQGGCEDLRTYYNLHMYGNDNAKAQFEAGGGRIDSETQPAVQNLPEYEKVIYTAPLSTAGQKAYDEARAADFLDLDKLTIDDFHCKYEF